MLIFIPPHRKLLRKSGFLRLRAWKVAMRIEPRIRLLRLGEIELICPPTWDEEAMLEFVNRGRRKDDVWRPLKITYEEDRAIAIFYDS